MIGRSQFILLKGLHFAKAITAFSLQNQNSPLKGTKAKCDVCPRSLVSTRAKYVPIMGPQSLAFSGRTLKGISRSSEVDPAPMMMPNDNTAYVTLLHISQYPSVSFEASVMCGLSDNELYVCM